MHRKGLPGKKELPPGKKELLLLLTPSVCSVLSNILLNQIETAYASQTGYYYHNQSESGMYGLWSFLLAVVSFASILVVIVVFEDVKNHQREECQRDLLSRQIADMESHIAQVERFYHDIRSLRHDMGNHIMMLEHLYAQDERAEAERYTARLKEELQRDIVSEENVIRSGNPVTDVILMEKSKCAAQRGIAFESMFRYPSEASVDAFDISVILSNALENAIESAAGCESPYIRITSRRRNHTCLIECENSSGFLREIDPETGLPVTTKENHAEHGFGLSNIRGIAQRYHGDIEIIQESGRFVLCVLLLLNEG